MKISGLGVDVVSVRNFNFKESHKKFLTNNFSKKELDYCFSFKSPAAHLAGTFAAKEAVFKALGREDILFTIIEIRRDNKGAPKVWIKNRPSKKTFVSISHTKEIATAVAVKQ